jgi:hypothetical protein
MFQRADGNKSWISGRSLQSEVGKGGDGPDSPCSECESPLVHGGVSDSNQPHDDPIPTSIVSIRGRADVPLQ